MSSVCAVGALLKSELDLHTLILQRNKTNHSESEEG